jgi:very-short-patch-repair endonuclease
MQHGLLSRAQGRNLGARRDDFRRRLASPEWEALTSQVLRLAGTSETFLQRCMAAALDAGTGAVISRRAAARLWGLPGFSEPEIDVSRPRGATRRATRLARVHEPRHLPAHHVTVVAGIPVTTVARTLFDLAADVHARRAERALDNALARNLVSLRSLRVVTSKLAEHGRPGSTLMRKLLAARPDAFEPPASGLEARFFEILRQAGLPVPERQRDLGSDKWVGRVDYLFRPFKLVAEIDSSIHHSTKLDQEADAARDQELRAAGFDVVRVRDYQIWQRPAEVVAVVGAALAESTLAEPILTSGVRKGAITTGFARQKAG